LIPDPADCAQTGVSSDTSSTTTSAMRLMGFPPWLSQRN
jgi:hypothetical protein